VVVKNTKVAVVTSVPLLFAEKAAKKLVITATPTSGE
jgi:hypothetical protein